MTVGRFAGIIETGRARYRGNVLSWGRSQEHNATLRDAHPDSLHLMGLAVDVWFHSSGEMAACAKFYVRSGLHVKKNGELTIHVQAFAPRPELDSEVERIIT